MGDGTEVLRLNSSSEASKVDQLSYGPSVRSVVGIHEVNGEYTCKVLTVDG